MNLRPNHHLTTATLLLAAVVGVATLGPSLSDTLAQRLDHDEGSAVPFVTSEEGADTVPAPSTNQTGASSTVPSLPGDDAAAGDDPNSPLALAPVETIVVVPAERDITVEIDGVRLASNGDGRIDVPEQLRGGTVTVLGRTAEPVVEQVAFSSWADGDTRTERSLTDLVGPVAQLGVTISTNVTVVGTESPANEAAVRFSSTGGAVEVPVGGSRWVVATLPVIGPSGITAVDLTYTAVSIVDASGATDVASQRFSPTPEALWQVQTEQSPGTESTTSP